MNASLSVTPSIISLMSHLLMYKQSLNVCLQSHVPLTQLIPTWLLKECLSDIAPSFAHIANLSFSSGIFPPCLKEALVHPLLKKVNLENNILKNYRPVSNLPFLSKVIEHIVSDKLTQHMSSNGLELAFQSAYTRSKCHSRPTETALLRVTNDLTHAVDQSGAAVLVLLDLSAAYH